MRRRGSAVDWFEPTEETNRPSPTRSSPSQRFLNRRCFDDIFGPRDRAFVRRDCGHLFQSTPLAWGRSETRGREVARHTRPRSTQLDRSLPIPLPCGSSFRRSSLVNGSRCGSWILGLQSPIALAPFSVRVLLIDISFPASLVEVGCL